MLKRKFGTTSLQVSALGFGAGHTGSDGVTEREAHVLLDRALELGVNFIDTARGYGLSEERIGRWLPARRDEVVLSTKVGCGVEGAADWSAAAVTGGVDEAVNLEAAAAAVARGPLPDAERARWEAAFAPHAGECAGEV